MVAEELLEQVAIRSMNLHAVEPGLYRACRTASEVVNDQENFLEFESARNGVRLRPVLRHRSPARADR